MCRLIKTLVILAVFSQSTHLYSARLDTLIMPVAKLKTIRAALPHVNNPHLVQILNSSHTLWYDDTVMLRSYQDSIGASSNDKWPDLVAASESIISGLHDRVNRRWQFPFSTTAGTDESTNLQVANFVYFPQENGEVKTINIKTVIMNASRPEWKWEYYSGTLFGEVLFIRDGSELLPVEIRTRTRHSAGWAMNVYRPFPRALDLSTAIKIYRPNWMSSPTLKSMVDFLEDNTTLKPASLKAKAKLSETFQQDGYIDVLPEFGDDTLVRELLKSTQFRSAYGMTWKSNGQKKTYAASTNSSLSIVPNRYMAGLIEVSDDSCMRCHKEASRLVSDFYFDLYLYGQVWGMDGIFSFHPYDEKHYPELRYEMVDNRHLNPTLKNAKIFRTSFRENELKSHFECKIVGHGQYRPYYLKAIAGGSDYKDYSQTPKGLLGQNPMTSMEECQKAVAAANQEFGVICSRTGLNGWKPTLYTGTVPGRPDFGYLGGSSILEFEDCLKATQHSTSKGVCFWGGSEWYVSPIDHEGVTAGPFGSIDECINKQPKGTRLLSGRNVDRRF